MDERRFEELERKRSGQGLTRDEADELGRMMAEKEGRPYSNADDRVHPDALKQEAPGLPGEGEQQLSEVQAKELREHPDVHGSEREEREEGEDRRAS